MGVAAFQNPTIVWVRQLGTITTFERSMAKCDYGSTVMKYPVAAMPIPPKGTFALRPKVLQSISRISRFASCRNLASPQAARLSNDLQPPNTRFALKNEDQNVSISIARDSARVFHRWPWLCFVQGRSTGFKATHPMEDAFDQ